MNDSLNNKELVAVGHQFAKAMSSDTPIIDMAIIVSRLAERLDCTTAALREMTKERDALAAENAGLKKYICDECYVENIKTGATKCAGHGMPETPATDSFLAEVRAQGVEMYASKLEECAKDAERGGFDAAAQQLRSEALAVREFAAQLRKGVQS